MSIRRSSLICVAYLQVYERVADNRWWPNIGGLLYSDAGASVSTTVLLVLVSLLQRRWYWCLYYTTVTLVLDSMNIVQ